MGKFSLPVKDKEKDEVPLELYNKVDINLCDLIEPKLIL